MAYNINRNMHYRAFENTSVKLSRMKKLGKCPKGLGNLLLSSNVSACDLTNKGRIKFCEMF